MNRTLHNGDCIAVMAAFPDASVDLVLCDLPYGTTACKWDTIVPLDELWAAYGRIARGPIVLTSAQPFTSKLVMSKPEWFRHEWIWDKVRPSGMLNAKRQPMMRHESVCVFAKHKSNYVPVMESRADVVADAIPGLEDVAAAVAQQAAAVSGRVASASDNYFLKEFDGQTHTYTEKYPQSIIRFCKPSRPIHPTQKPVELMEYMINTYSKPGDVVLDNCMGSGTTGIACANTGRHFIGIEKDVTIYDAAVARITAATGPDAWLAESSANGGLFANL